MPEAVAPTPVVTVRTLFLAGLALLAVVVTGLVLWHVLHVVLVVLTASILAEGLRPAVNALNRRRVPFALSIGAVYLALVVAVLGLVAVLTGPVVSGITSISNYEQILVADVNQLLDMFHMSGQQLAALATTLLSAAGGVALSLVRVGGGVVGFVGDLVSILILSITWMAASRDLGNFIVGLFPARRRALVSELIAEVGHAFAGYVRGVTVNIMVIGGLAMLACWLLGLPAPVLLGVFAGLCELIPLLGPFPGAVPAVLLGFSIGPLYPLVVAGAFLALQQLESNVLTPVVMQHEVGLRPFLVIMALLLGAALAGIWGALVAVPIASAIQIVVVRVVAPAIRARQAVAAAAQHRQPEAREVATSAAGQPRRNAATVEAKALTAQLASKGCVEDCFDKSPVHRARCIPSR